MGPFPPPQRSILGPRPFPRGLPLLRPPLPPPSFFIRKQLAADRAQQIQALKDAKKKKKAAKAAAEGETAQPAPSKKKEKLLQEWMTPELLELIRERDKRHSRIKKKAAAGRPEVEEALREFKVFRNEVTTKIRSAKVAAGILTRKMKPPKPKEGEDNSEEKGEGKTPLEVAEERGEIEVDVKQEEQEEVKQEEQDRMEVDGLGQSDLGNGDDLV